MDLHLLPSIFFTRCEEHLDIDSVFQPPMDDRMKREFMYCSE